MMGLLFCGHGLFDTAPQDLLASDPSDKAAFRLFLRFLASRFTAFFQKVLMSLDSYPVVLPWKLACSYIVQMHIFALLILCEVAFMTIFSAQYPCTVKSCSTSVFDALHFRDQTTGLIRGISICHQHY